jgi:hypothetical protein
VGDRHDVPGPPPPDRDHDQRKGHDRRDEHAPLPRGRLRAGDVLPDPVEHGRSVPHRADGYVAAMTEHNENEKLEAIQAVVDRVTSWQDGATEGTVEQELRDGFREAGVDVPDDDVTKLADAIQDRHGAVSAQEVLSA